MVDNHFFYDAMLRFELARKHPELLARLKEQEKHIDQEWRDNLKRLSKQFGCKIKLSPETVR